MSAANGLKSGDPDATRLPWRRGAANLVAAFKVVTRRAADRSRSPWMAAPQQLAATGGALAIFLLSMFLLDGAAISAVAKLPHSVAWFFDQITDFGKSGWFLWPLGILFLVLAALPVLSRVQQGVLAAVMARTGFLFAAIALPGIFTNIVKHIFGRARPGVGGSVDPTLFAPFSWPAAYAGLPSGHATTAFSVLVAFGALFPRARGVLWIYALLICASRVALTAHYPSDVFVGALVGTVGALMVRCYFALRGLGFTVGADGTVRSMPGPSPRRIKAVARDLLGP